MVVRLRARARNGGIGCGQARGHCHGWGSDVGRMWGTRVDGLSEPGRKTRRSAQSTLAIAHVLYEGAYGLRPVSFVSVGLLGGLTCLLFTAPKHLAKAALVVMQE